MESKKFDVLFSPAALRDIEQLGTADALQLASGYRPPLYRLCSGDFRAYYRIHAREVVILTITHKKDSEKILKKLK